MFIYIIVFLTFGWYIMALDTAQLRAEVGNLKDLPRKELRLNIEKIINQVDVTHDNMLLLKEALDLVKKVASRETSAIYQRLIDKCPPELMPEFYIVFQEYVPSSRPLQRDSIPSASSGDEGGSCDWMSWYH